VDFWSNHIFDPLTDEIDTNTANHRSGSCVDTRLEDLLCDAFDESGNGIILLCYGPIYLRRMELVEWLICEEMLCHVIDNPWRYSNLLPTFLITLNE
jgi:hypothetical protein